MKIEHISYRDTTIDKCLDLVNKHIELNGIKKEDILKFDIKETPSEYFDWWKIHLFYYKE